MTHSFNKALREFIIDYYINVRVVGDVLDISIQFDYVLLDYTVV